MLKKYAEQAIYVVSIISSFGGYIEDAFLPKVVHGQYLIKLCACEMVSCIHLFTLEYSSR